MSSSSSSSHPPPPQSSSINGDGGSFPPAAAQALTDYTASTCAIMDDNPTKHSTCSSSSSSNKNDKKRKGISDSKEKSSSHVASTMATKASSSPRSENNKNKPNAAAAAAANGTKVDAVTPDDDDPTCTSSSSNSLVKEEDRDLVSERVFLMMEQLIPITKDKAQRASTGSTRGIACRHCIDDTQKAKGSRSFGSSGISYAGYQGHFMKHIQTCQRCPDEIRNEIRDLATQQDRSTTHRPKKGGGNRQEFYQRVWNRVHGTEGSKGAGRANQQPKRQKPSRASNKQAPIVPPVAAAAVARQPASQHPLFTHQDADKFPVSTVYHAWRHEIDPETTTTRGVSRHKVASMKKIVTAVDDIVAQSMDDGVDVAAVVKCFDQVQSKKRIYYTKVAENMDELKETVRRLLRKDSASSAQPNSKPKQQPRRNKKKALPPAQSDASQSESVAPPNAKRQKTKDPPAQQQNDGPKLLLEDDPNKVYVEETAFLFHDPKEEPDEAANEELVTSAELKPLPPPPRGLPPFPEDSAVRWEYNEETRVLLADFTAVSEENLVAADMDFLATMFERDDITCITQGLLDPAGLDAEVWGSSAIRKKIGNRTHHNFKRFHQDEDGNYVEMHGMLDMSIDSFFEYLDDVDRRNAALLGGADTSTNLVIQRPGHKKGDLELDAVKDVLYMIDLDLPKLLPRNSADFLANFKMKEILPGGKWCMMNALPESARPFMGPNWYMAQPGAYTQLHQDGHGTVDSGHIALSGYNEVVMLRRLPERHKAEANKRLPHATDKEGNTVYDSMYGLPHDQTVQPRWPTRATIAGYKKMGYCPSVFILKPGQHVHINKGRLHAFRKMTFEELPKDDCHYDLRKAVIGEVRLMENAPTKAPTCVSIAWDWQFAGVHAEGIHRESVAVLESSLLVDRKDGADCLAIPEASLLAMAQQVLPTTPSFGRPLISSSIVGAGGRIGSKARPSVVDNINVARGILPVLRFLVEKNSKVIKYARATGGDQEEMEIGRVLVAPSSDCDLNPRSRPLDPDGSDYFCRECKSELGNIYLHCDGCENHLEKDFNICVRCHGNKVWKKTIQMCPTDSQRKSTINHTGDMPMKRQSKCPCKKGKPCLHCDFCTGCSCICHTCFTLRRRHYDEDTLEKMLQQVIETASEPLEYDAYTEARLLCAANRNVAGYNAKRKLLAQYPRNGTHAAASVADVASPMSAKERAELLSDEQAEDKPVVDENIDKEDDRKMPAVDRTGKTAADE